MSPLKLPLKLSNIAQKPLKKVLQSDFEELILTI